MHVLKSWPWIGIQSTYLTECTQMFLNWDTVFCSLKRRRDTSFKVLNTKCHMQQHCDYLWNAQTCFVIFGTWCANSGVCVCVCGGVFLMYSKPESMCGSFIHKVFFKLDEHFFSVESFDIKSFIFYYLNPKHIRQWGCPCQRRLRKPLENVLKW